MNTNLRAGEGGAGAELQPQGHLRNTYEFNNKINNGAELPPWGHLKHTSIHAMLKPATQEAPWPSAIVTLCWVGDQHYVYMGEPSCQTPSPDTLTSLMHTSH